MNMQYFSTFELRALRLQRMCHGTYHHDDFEEC